MIKRQEASFEEVKKYYSTLNSDLVKMEYLEYIMKTHDFGIEFKRFLLKELSKLYEKRLMFEKAAKASEGLATFEVTYREKRDSYTKAAEFYCQTGNIIAAEDMFIRAVRECGNPEERNQILSTRKQIYIAIAAKLENTKRMAHAIKFYEKILTLKNLTEEEKQKIKLKIIDFYKKTGRFMDAKRMEGM